MIIKKILAAAAIIVAFNSAAPAAETPYGDISQTHTLGLSLGLGYLNGVVTDPYTDSEENPHSWLLSFHYNYHFCPYGGIVANLSFINSEVSYNFNGVDSDGLVINRNGTLAIDQFPLSLGIFISPGFFTANPYLQAGLTGALWSSVRDEKYTMNGTYQISYSDGDSSGMLGWFAAAGFRLKPQKYVSYFFEGRYYGLPNRDIFEYKKFGMGSVHFLFGVQFDYFNHLPNE
jgi:hypothetical protein